MSFDETHKCELSYFDAKVARNCSELTDLGKTFVNIINHGTSYHSTGATVVVYADGETAHLPCKSEQHAWQVVAALQGKYL